MRNRKRYARNFKRRARAAKEAANWQCTKCGAVHGSKRYSQWVERDVTVWLQAHHVNCDPENENADLGVVCPRCHYRVYHANGKRPAWLIESLKHRRLIVVAYLV